MERGRVLTRNPSARTPPTDSGARPQGIDDTAGSPRAKSPVFRLRFCARGEQSFSFSHAMSRFKVLVADPISQRGVNELSAGGALDISTQTGLKEDELIRIIGEYSALVVRSETKVNARVIEAATKLKVVGRAGVGVDNVDVDAATKRGIIVMNTPGGN